MRMMAARGGAGGDDGSSDDDVDSGADDSRVGGTFGKLLVFFGARAL